MICILGNVCKTNELSLLEDLNVQFSECNVDQEGEDMRMKIFETMAHKWYLTLERPLDKLQSPY